MIVTCARCGDVFESGWTDAEALAEVQRLFPGETRGTTVPVCDRCYEWLLAQYGRGRN